MNEDLQCVPYARALTGIEIRGDAHTWWDQAQGRYQRGEKPRVGAIMSFRPHGSMQLGHVAAVRQIIDSRTVIISHANWSTINGKRGHVEENVKVVDASDAGDWSRVRVWYTPNDALGTTEWPLNGFIYPKQRRSDHEALLALAQLLGGNARITPAGQRQGEVRVAVKADTALARSFNLSSRTLSEVTSKAANEQKTTWPRPAAPIGRMTKPAPTADKDVIGDLIGSLGN
ncbi:CHAP domain-containing protein [Sphingorhabdus arenilitoris]|uniref:CHAP domain-containing protein n=1 Tax=Sphingorhabdus arenilitoris TaxID=1490041 RepID=A0ABV8RIE8_9SPHN